MFVSVSNDLPRTSYIKMIDVWLVFNLFIPFVEVLLHIYKVIVSEMTLLALPRTRCSLMRRMGLMAGTQLGR